MDNDDKKVFIEDTQLDYNPILSVDLIFYIMIKNKIKSLVCFVAQFVFLNLTRFRTDISFFLHMSDMF